MRRGGYAAAAGLAWLLVFAADPVRAVSALEWGAQISVESFTWAEETQCGTLKERGPRLTGGGYLSAPPLARLPSLRLRGDLQGSLAWVDYDTAVQSGSTCSPENTDTFYLGLLAEGGVGWRLGLRHGWFEPFAGLAFRNWRRHIQDGPTAKGYPETYRLLYGRGGLRFVYGLPEGLRLTGSFSVDPVLWAKEVINWGDVTGETLKVDNGKRMGWTVETGVLWMGFDLRAYWQAVRLGESTRVSCYSGTRECFQPKSRWDVIGLKLGYLF